MKKIKIGISIAIVILGAGILWWQLENKTGIEAKENQIAYQPPAAVASKLPINVNTTQSSPPVIPLPLPPVKDSLITTFDDLKKLADAGDRKASCRLGLELVRCKWHNGYVAAHKKNIEILAAMSKDDAKYSETSRQNQHFERLIARDKSVCAGFPMESTTDGWRYVFAAASAGDGYSAVQFAQGISLLSPTEPRPLDTAEGWVAYRQNAFPMLEQALEQLATVVTHGRFRVRVDDERVRNFDPFGHGLLHPKRPSGAERVAARFLQTGTRASAGWADRQRPVDGRKTLVVVRDRIRRTARK